LDYICDVPGGKTWFRIETEGEAAQESQLMRHAVEKHFVRERAKALATYVPSSPVALERDIGLKAHVRRAMPLFLTLRDGEGEALATAMLPPLGREDRSFKPVIVGAANSDPYPDHAEAIEELGRHFGLALDRARCFPYRRS